MSKLKDLFQKIHSNKKFGNSIKNRIRLSFTTVLLAIIVFIQILIIFFMDNYYYGSVEKLLKERVNITSEFLNKYEEYSDIDGKANFLFNTLLGEFDKRFLVQILNNDGIVIMDSFNSTTNKKINSDDFNSALKNKIEVSIEKDSNTGERIMSVSRPLIRYSSIDGVLRYSVSLSKIDETFIKYYSVTIIFSILLIIISLRILSLLSGTIVYPIEKLTTVARNMANGNMEVRAEKVYDDEIGELADTLNFMAQEIEKNNQLKKDFISSISHELRTPLTSIKGWGEVLLVSESKPNTSLEIGLKIISSEADRLKDMVEELLDFAKLETHKMSINKKKILFNNIVKSVYNQMLPRAEGIDFTVDYDEEDIYIFGDPNRLRQVLINLITNSIKFANENPKIEINTKKEEDNVKLIISDNGIGISQENIKKVKEKFFKEDINSSGSGIGLALVDEIIKAHDGTMEIESEKNKGTTIILTIPLLIEESE